MAQQSQTTPLSSALWTSEKRWETTPIIRGSSKPSQKLATASSARSKNTGRIYPSQGLQNRPPWFRQDLQRTRRLMLLRMVWKRILPATMQPDLAAGWARFLLLPASQRRLSSGSCPTNSTCRVQKSHSHICRAKKPLLSCTLRMRPHGPTSTGCARAWRTCLSLISQGPVTLRCSAASSCMSCWNALAIGQAPRSVSTKPWKLPRGVTPKRLFSAILRRSAMKSALMCRFTRLGAVSSSLPTA